MPRSLILDSNVLLFDPQAMLAFPDDDLFIPMAVIREIDKFKHEQTETGRNARTAIAALEQLRTKGPLRFGIQLDNGASLTVVPECAETPATHRSAAAQLLALAKEMAKSTDPEQIVVVTKNISLRLQADAAGISATDYNPYGQTGTDTLKGWHLISATQPQIENLKQGRPLPPSPNIAWNPNEYALIRDRDNTASYTCAKFNGRDSQLWPLIPQNRPVCGIRPLNVEQVFSMDALLDDAITLVTLAGKAGTGKTLLAIAAGLHQVFAENKYDKLLIFRPTMPVSRDLGYLPGDIGEKMKPWMQPVFDALNFIKLQDKKSPARSLPDDLLSCPEIAVEPLTYIRGRSIPNQFIIIDEAQNLTPLEVKTAVTRCGKGSKIILTGDPDQIDNPYLDASSNGLTRIVERFLHTDLSAHVTLLKGERSILAETASKLL